MDDARRQGHDEVVRILESAESWPHKNAKDSRLLTLKLDYFQQQAALTFTDFDAALHHVRHKICTFARGTTQLLVLSLIKSVRKCEELVSFVVFSMLDHIRFDKRLHTLSQSLRVSPATILLASNGVIMLLLGALFFKSRKIATKSG